MIKILYNKFDNIFETILVNKIWNKVENLDKVKKYHMKQSTETRRQ